MTALHKGGRLPHFQVIVFKSLRLQVSTRIRFCCVFKSFHSGERFQKFSLRRAFSKVFDYSLRFRRIRVDESRMRNKMFAHANESRYVRQGLRGRQEHALADIDDFIFGKDENDVGYVQFNDLKPTKTRQGGLRMKRRGQLPVNFY